MRKICLLLLSFIFPLSCNLITEQYNKDGDRVITATFLSKSVSPDMFDDAELLKVREVNWMVFNSRGEIVNDEITTLSYNEPYKVRLQDGETYTVYAFANYQNFDQMASKSLYPERIPYKFTTYHSLEERGLPQVAKLEFTACACGTTVVELNPLFAKVVVYDDEKEFKGVIVSNTPKTLYFFDSDLKNEDYSDYSVLFEGSTKVFYVPEHTQDGNSRGSFTPTRFDFEYGLSWEAESHFIRNFNVPSENGEILRGETYEARFCPIRFDVN